MLVGFPRLQQARGEVVVVHRVGEMLGLQAEAGVLVVRVSVAGNVGAVEEVAAVELHAFHGGRDAHGAAGLAFGHIRALLKVVARVGEYHAVVVSTRFVDILADAFAGGEVERGARHRSDLSCRYQRVVHRQVLVAIELDLVVQHIVAVARQVEVGVVGEVHRGGPVADRRIGDLQLAFGEEYIVDMDFQGSGEAHRALFADVGQMQGRSTVDFAGQHVPYLGVQALGAAVQGVRAIVAGNLVVPAVDAELAVLDAVGESADQSTEVGRAPFVFAQSRIPQDDICFPAVLVRCDQIDDDTAVGRYIHGVFTRLQRVKHHLVAVLRSIPINPLVDHTPPPMLYSTTKMLAWQGTWYTFSFLYTKLKNGTWYVLEKYN